VARQPAPGTRDRILDVAGQLFYEHGVHAVGLQQVIDELGCGKNLLYREFPSKDDLVVAWLEQCRDHSLARLETVAARHPDDPARQLVAHVQDAADGVESPGARGCALRNTHTEFPDPDHPAHQLAVRHVAAVRTRLQDLARQAGAREPEVLADRIMLVIDGVIANGALLGRQGAAAAAVELAEEVVRSSVPARPGRSGSRARSAAPGGARGAQRAGATSQRDTSTSEVAAQRAATAKAQR
jgi:AcrR family transcriptional regulator